MSHDKSVANVNQHLNHNPMSRFTCFLASILLLFAATPLLAAPPVINAAPSTPQGCASLFVQFNNTTQATTHYWDFGPGNGTSTLQAPGVIFLNAGTHTVTYTATDASGPSVKTWNIVVHPKPVVDFTASPTTVCQGTPIQFTDASVPGGTGTATYSWVLGGAGNSSKNPSYVFPVCGVYDVTLKVTNQFGCEATVMKPNMVTVHCNPNVSFAATPTTHCVDPNITQAPSNFLSVVSGGTQPYSYLWDFGNGVGAPLNTQPNPSVPYNVTAPTAYSVKLKVTDANGCTAEVVKPDYIKVEKITPGFTVSPTAACVFTAVTVTNTSTSTAPGPLYTSWDWGDNSGNTIGSPAVHYYSTPGTKTIKLTTANGPCMAERTQNITIYPQPVLGYQFTPAQPCPAPQVLSFTGTGATSYVWDFGTPPGGTGSNPSHLYANNGFYTVTLVGTDNNGCKDTLNHVDTVKIYDGFLEAVSDTPGGCVPQSVCFKAPLYTTFPYVNGLPGKHAYPYNIVSYEWDFGDGGTSTQANPCHVFYKIQKSRVTVKVVTANGCTFRDTLEVIHDTLPKPGFYIAPTHICNRQHVYGYDTSKKYAADTSSTSINHWKWELIPITNVPPATQITIVDDPNPKIKILYPAIYNVIFTVAKNYCWDTLMADSVIKVDVPRADFTYKVSCDTPLKVQFTNKSYGYHGISNPSYKWYFGDPANTTSTALHPSFTYPALGNYTVMIVAFNDTLNCSDTFTNTVALQVPKLDLTAHDTTICPTEWVNFTSSVSNGSVTDYYWYVNGVPVQLYGNTFKHQFNTPGFQTVMLVTKDINQCLDTATKTDYIVVSRPVVDFTNPMIGCKPFMVNFTDNTTRFPNTPLANLASRYWDFGNGNATTTATTISNLYPLTGHYDVKLVVTDINGCKDSIVKVKQVNVYKPKAMFDAFDLNACIGQDIAFFNKSDSGISAYWEFGDGGISNDYSPTHSYAQTGVYDVRMVVTDKQGCTDTMLRTAYIKVNKPFADFTMDDTFAICHPHQVRFTNNSGPQRNLLKHLWDFGNGTSVLEHPLNVYNQPGYFTVTLIETDQEGCTDTAYGHVNVLGYDGVIDYNPLSGCKPLTVNFTADVTNIPSVIWDFNDGHTIKTTTTAPVSHTYTIPGAYIPKIIFNDGKGCSSSSAGKDTIKVDGIFPGFEHTPACEGYMVQFEDTSRGRFSAVTQWWWTFDDGKTSPVKKPYHYYPNTGSFPVSLIITNANGCKDTVEKTLTINPLPVVSAGADTIICLKDAAQLTGTGGVSYVWLPDAWLSCDDCPDPKASPERKIEYTMIGTDANGCSDTDKVVVDIQLKTTSLTGEGGEICDDEFVQLRASGAHTYLWLPGEGLNNNTSPDPVASPDRTTNYMVIAKEGSCIPDTNYVKVVVHPKPTVRATGETTIIAGKSTPIDASGDLIKRFEWSPSESLTCSDCPSPMANPWATTTYVVRVYTEFNCADSAKVTITVLCDESQLFIPNTFTPNGDGMNDVFYPRGVGLDKVITLRVYNRWGEIVYDRKDFDLNSKQAGWDGTYKGSALPPDVFVYLVEAQCDNGDILKLKGDITLIR